LFTSSPVSAAILFANPFATSCSKPSPPAITILYR